MDPVEVKAVEWPKAKIGGTEYTFRLAYSANSQLYAWGFSQQKVPIAAWAAAMAGHFDKNGNWRSAGFTRWVDVADAVLDEEQEALAAAVDIAIKKVSPASQTSLETEPAKNDAPATN